MSDSEKPNGRRSDRPTSSANTMGPAGAPARPCGPLLTTRALSVSYATEQQHPGSHEIPRDPGKSRPRGPISLATIHVSALILAHATAILHRMPAEPGPTSSGPTSTTTRSPRISNAAPETAWAKTRSTAEGRVPALSLADHSMDVAAVAEALLTSPMLRLRLGKLAGRPLTDTDIARLSFFAGLHDIGKVVHPFQRHIRCKGPGASHTAPVWALLGSARSPSTIRKSLVGWLRRRRWRRWFSDPLAGDEEASLWDVVLAHHGRLPSEPPPARAQDWSRDPRTGYDPGSAVAEVTVLLEGMFPNAFAAGAATLPTAPRFLHALAGVVVLADWLGSDERHFRFPDTGVPSGAARIEWSRGIAAEAIRRLRFDSAADREKAGGLTLDFRELFPEARDPRPAQRALLKAPLPEPGQIVVLEAETGSGKTEAALVHFLRLFREGEVDGMYFALPTRAAAFQIHRRIATAVQRWFGPEGPPVGLAVPGYFRVDDDQGQRLPDSWRVLWDDERTPDRSWAVENSMRYLAGAVMVGTVDQALLGALKIRHAQVRSGPMLRLLLVIDEVHASDAYMTRLLRNLLDQHTKAGGHALLMSATLGSSARERLLRPGARIDNDELPGSMTAKATPYPLVQRAAEAPRALDPVGSAKTVSLELCESETDAVYERLRQAADAGAAVLFIRNLVADACESVRRLEEIGAGVFRCNGVVAPHHSRFAPEDRRLLDGELEDAFKNRSEGFIAVTTQTAEQSLDICADWLVTDIAPGDVLLQRIGRLHRHATNPRPAGFESPRLTVIAPSPSQVAGLLRSDGGRRRGKTLLGLGTVYENLAGVLATRDWLARHGVLRVPEDCRALVEAVTHHEGLRAFAASLGESMSTHLEAVLIGSQVQGGAAANVMLDWEQPLAANQPPANLEAATRLGLKDRRLELPRPCVGPFDSLVHSLHLPAWMVEDVDEKAEPEDVVPSTGVVRFRLGPASFRYDRFGLRRAGSNA